VLAVVKVAKRDLTAVRSLVQIGRLLVNYRHWISRLNMAH